MFEIKPYILRRQLMKDLDVFLKTVVDGMKVMAQGIETLAEKLDTIAKARLDETPKRKAEAKPARKAPAKPKKPVQKKEKPATAAETVLSIINRSKKGVDTATLMKKTGYNQKKIANLVFKLRKQGKIKNVAKGVYVKA
jgi:predicted Rossmann fold nucleotide-binding protein DprA/Smf involved in DNA uptake